MKMKLYTLLGAVGILFCSCNKDKKEDQVVSQRYVHKYGYAVSKEEWEAKNYPGQVITHMKNGSILTATYENGELHGPCTFTYPESQTIEKYVLYNRGKPVKEILYDISGMPVQESVQLSANRHSFTQWFSDGAPRSIEEFTLDELVDGQYFTVNNEVEARVEKGKGQRIQRDSKGVLLAQENFEVGYPVKKETFYPSGSPESIAFYADNKLHGEKKTFTASGEPVSIEEWIGGRLHGKSTYFKNGTKFLETSYLYGEKNGLETHYVDGINISHQITWDSDKKHGAEVFFVEGEEKVSWFYAGDHVSKSRYDELVHLDEIVSSAHGEGSSSAQ